jgi:AraC-like DNA-binding protein
LDTQTFYQQEVLRIRQAQYRHDYLFRQAIQAKQFIDKHFSKDINLDEIANTAFFSKFHFIRLFKSIYDKTPHQYLTSVRLDNAKKHLQAGKSIAETCNLVGFKSITSFTGLFKRATGLTPAAFLTADKQTLAQGEVPKGVLGFAWDEASPYGRIAILKKTN